jgi:hypothetical protein
MFFMNLGQRLMLAFAASAVAALVAAWALAS